MVTATKVRLPQRLTDAVESVLAGRTSRTDVPFMLSDKRKARFIVYRLNDVVPVRVDLKIEK